MDGRRGGCGRLRLRDEDSGCLEMEDGWDEKANINHFDGVNAIEGFFV